MQRQTNLKMAYWRILIAHCVLPELVISFFLKQSGSKDKIFHAFRFLWILHFTNIFAKRLLDSFEVSLKPRVGRDSEVSLHFLTEQTHHFETISCCSHQSHV